MVACVWQVIQYSVDDGYNIQTINIGEYFVVLSSSLHSYQLRYDIAILTAINDIPDCIINLSGYDYVFYLLYFQSILIYNI